MGQENGAGGFDWSRPYGSVRAFKAGTPQGTMGFDGLQAVVWLSQDRPRGAVDDAP
jgi:hypothetical protein